MGRTLSRVAGIVSAGALITFAAAPAALAEDETPTSETTTTTSETTTTTTAPTSTETTAPSSPVTTTGTTSAPATTEVTTTTTPKTTSSAPESAEPPKDDYRDNAGAGFVGLGGEGVLVIACASGRPGGVATQYLSVTGGPDQDEADGRYWNYSVRVVDAPAGTTTAKFSWTCDGVEGYGIVEFEQEQPPVSTSTATSSSSTSSTAPIATATGSAPAGNAAPKAQVKVAPKGGVETGFGGTAR
ncbi:hypothetical protein Q5425_09830 [Amycolatopsis sp. A133]|uniref:hypothetical protein n=1 Tax=Amycolatopsis sp. A133 TaxID=3064472 RepID=UPI0027FA1225|nr:hypothetical protein [Amycolatopsis sp. A133]MDQ7804033.1 hypothetical protein [Amycolatopsis sp. A133]